MVTPLLSFAECGGRPGEDTGFKLPALIDFGVAESMRPLRMRVHGLRSETVAGVLWLEFRLGRGSYATVVLREIGCFRSSPGSG